MGSSRNHSEYGGRDRLSSETIHNLRAPLTVIKAQAQMVERWAHRNTDADVDVVLRRLEVIDMMVARLVGELDELRDVPPSRHGTVMPEDGTSEP